MPRVRPFLKWAGGKRQLLPQLRRFYPADFDTYHEPFLGSGAVFFDLAGSGRLDGRRAELSDENPDLIGCYLRVRDSLDAVLAALGRLDRGHARGEADHYRQVRDRRFNPARRSWRRAGAAIDAYSPDLAAMFIYLNRTGYNGLFRVNRSGDFNVPPGRYARPRIIDAELLTAASRALAAPGVSIRLAGFATVIERVAANDFVYFDPPYAPLSATANFRSYTARGFSDADQARLQQVVVTLASRGATVILSNSVAPLVTQLFEGNLAAHAAGLTPYRVQARRAINARADRRGLIEELIVTNGVAS
ncbi:MAG: Dam family site-specific DNA-(adenine-N6)-methyltransferase [Acidobacteria bacterium]|nr:Dam family site-specific DNA-(adenine-N6)-methyltransferase [Acidobacteriota bacterium]